MLSYKVKKIPSLLPPALVLFCMAAFLAFPARYAECVRNGISLWAVSVLPATFPFLFLTALFTRLKLYRTLSNRLSPLAGKAFRISGAGAGAAVLSALSGYPVGARMIFDLYEKRLVSQDETFRLACLCSTSGPMFLVGTVGSMMFQNANAGWIMLISHLAAVWSVCFILRFFARPKSQTPPPSMPSQESNAMYESLYQAVISILCVGGFIALFSAFSQMLSDLGVFPESLFGAPENVTQGVLRGLLEMTTGCALLAKTPSALSAALACMLVTFGGVCVLCQQLSYFKRARVNTLLFLAVKAVQSVLAFALCFGLCALLGVF